MQAPPSSPLKLLELTIVSAHNLPPVSKMLRTFAVAYVSPDHKLTTRIDHTGHTNPAWNYKVAFHVDDRFLKSESSAVTIEIYNLAWLRDLPIGTCRLLISSLSPPLIKNPAFRRVALRVCRPSGHLQGTLHIGVQLVDTVVRGEEELFEEDGVANQQEGNGYYVKEEELLQNGGIKDQDDKNPGPAQGPSSIPSPMSRATSRPESDPETRTIATSAGSLYSVMRPLPSEVAADLKKGLYSAADWKDYGSSVFEGWTEEGEDRSEGLAVGPAHEPWPTVEEPMGLPTPEKRFGGWKRKRRRPDKKKKGLFSCFGNAYGFQFSIVCGSKGLKKKTNRNVNKQNIHLMSLQEDNQHRYYV